MCFCENLKPDLLENVDGLPLLVREVLEAVSAEDDGSLLVSGVVTVEVIAGSILLDGPIVNPCREVGFTSFTPGFHHGDAEQPH